MLKKVIAAVMKGGYDFFTDVALSALCEGG